MSGQGTQGAGLRRAGIWAGVIAAILAVPLVAMQFSDEVKWTAFDFAFIGALMGAVATVYELAARRGAMLYRAGVAVALAAGFLLIWVSGAVGIIGSEDDAANLVFLIVPATAIAGALLARFESAGLARAFAATALVQTLIGAGAIAAGSTGGASRSTWDVVLLTGLFAAFWVAAAWLFRRAARGA